MLHNLVVVSMVVWYRQGWIYIARGSRRFWWFRCIFLHNKGEDQKMVFARFRGTFPPKNGRTKTENLTIQARGSWHGAIR